MRRLICDIGIKKLNFMVFLMGVCGTLYAGRPFKCPPKGSEQYVLLKRNLMWLEHQWATRILYPYEAQKLYKVARATRIVLENNYTMWFARRRRKELNKLVRHAYWYEHQLTWARTRITHSKSNIS